MRSDHKRRRARLGGVLLVLVIECIRDRMVRVVGLGDHVRDRQLQAVGEMARFLVARREAELGAEIDQDVGDMRDDDLAVAQERRRERERAAASSAEASSSPRRRAPPFVAGDVDVGRPRLLQREPDELAAPLDFGPVEELVSHCVLPRLKSAAACGRRP